MKWVLIFVVFPTTWHAGNEKHVQFDSLTACRMALTDFAPARDHFKVCVPQDEEFWYFENLSPLKDQRK